MLRAAPLLLKVPLRLPITPRTTQRQDYLDQLLGLNQVAKANIYFLEEL